MMTKPKIAVMGFSDGDPQVHQTLKQVVQEQVDTVVAALLGTGNVEVCVADQLICSADGAKKAAMQSVAQDVDGTIFCYGVFSFPNFSAIAAQNGKGPFLLVATMNPDWPGMVAMLAAGGALHHLGIEHFRVAGDVKEPEILEQILSFTRCARAASRLNGQTYGLFGGRSLGMYSATVDMQGWQRQFGVDIEHIDQSEILRIAETIPQEKVERAFEWLSSHVKRIEYDGDRLTPEKLKTQIRHYEATKEIAHDRQLDFVGVKCHYELSRNYCTQCISAALMNDPYDWDGPKEPVVFACEADGDAALTMQILKLLTNEPVLFMDVRHYDSEHGVMVFCNCGSEATYYAGHSLDPAENLRNVTLSPCLEIYSGGGCHVNCMTAPGKATIARLNRYEGKYRMTIIPVEFVTLPEEKMAETTREWPHVFARLPFDYNRFIQKFDANHCHAVYGDHTHELETVCKMLEIDVEYLA